MALFFLLCVRSDQWMTVGITCVSLRLRHLPISHGKRDSFAVSVRMTSSHLPSLARLNGAAYGRRIAFQNSIE